jgi:hypothetical protein
MATRRTILSAVAATLACPGAGADPGHRHDDAELIAVCEEFMASEAAYHALYMNAVSDEEAETEGSAILATWNGMLDRMAQLRATTIEAIAARALCLAQHSRPGDAGNYPFAYDPGEDTVNGRMLDYLLRDGFAIATARVRHGVATEEA